MHKLLSLRKKILKSIFYSKHCPESSISYTNRVIYLWISQQNWKIHKLQTTGVKILYRERAHQACIYIYIQSQAFVFSKDFTLRLSSTM